VPVIKSAIKKLRKDKVRTVRNDIFRKSLERAIKVAKKQKTAKTLSLASSFVDRAVKNNLLHKNRAARIKRGLSKLSKPAAKAKTQTSQVKKKTASKILPKKR